LFFVGSAKNAGVCPSDTEPHSSDGTLYRVILNDLGPAKLNDSWQNWQQTLKTITVAYHMLPTTLDQLLSIVDAAEAAGKHVRAVGSAWAFSDVAATDDFLVETHGLNAALWNVVPTALTREARQRRLYHVEAGVTIRELYTRLDRLGMAVPTLGGAGGQTLAGAVSTGTHGGDIDIPSVAGMVRAIHLVGAGGVHYWIEPKRDPITTPQALLGAIPYIDPDHIVYDDDWFDSVLVSMGCMGIIYALVIEARTPYDLQQTQVQLSWTNDVRPALVNGSLFKRLDPRNHNILDEHGAQLRNRFVAVTMTPNSVEGDRVCFVSTREEVQPVPTVPDPAAVGFDVLDTLCKIPDFGPLILGVFLPLLTGALSTAAGAALAIPVVGPILHAIILGTIPVVTGALTTLAAEPNLNLERAVVGIWNIADTVSIFLGGALTPVLAKVNEILLSTNLTTGIKQGTSFRIMDTFNYSNPDCFKGDSVEAFFDVGTLDHLNLDKVDGLLSTIDATAAVAGYLSLRFMGPTQAILGMQQAALNCSIEVSLIRGVLYNDKVMRAIETYTLDNGGRLHWGQRNDLLTAMQLNETMYPRLTSWRNVRSALTRQGTLHTFDNSFTARCGL
jgi:hypothetical protein